MRNPLNQLDCGAGVNLRKARQAQIDSLIEIYQVDGGCMAVIEYKLDEPTGTSGTKTIRFEIDDTRIEIDDTPTKASRASGKDDFRSLTGPALTITLMMTPIFSCLAQLRQ